MKKWLDKYESKGEVKNSLNRTVTCSNCGWSWKLSDGGEDPLTCHKCGGTIKMKHGGEHLDEYKEKGEVKQSFRDQLLQRNGPIIDKTAAPILLPSNLNYDKTRVVNGPSAGLNKTQLKNVYQNLEYKAEQEKKQELEDYKAAKLFHENNPVAKLLGTRKPKPILVEPTARELAYGFGAGINNFYDVPGIGIANDFVNPLSLVSKGIISPWYKAPLQAQQSDSYFPYLGAAVSTALTVPMVRPASIAAKTFLNPKNIYTGALEAGNVYNNIATGNSIIPRAWKSPAVGLSQNASDVMFKGLLNSNKLTDAERALIVEYQYDSKPFTGTGILGVNQEKKEALNNIIKKYNLNFNNNSILTRRFNPENKSLGADFVNDNLNLRDRPTSFSAGVGVVGYKNSMDRLVIPNRYAKKMGNNFLANNYEALSDDAINLVNPKVKNFASDIGKTNTEINAEREVIGTGLNFKRIGKVKNDIGGYDHVVKPANTNGNLIWEKPNVKQLAQEYDIEHELKNLNLFKNKDEFINAVKNAKEEEITKGVDNLISNRSRTTSKKDLLSLSMTYKSYPKYRNEKTIEDIYTTLNLGGKMDMPIILEYPNGERRVFSGNTRMDLSFQSGINPKALIIKVPIKKQEGGELDEYQTKGEVKSTFNPYENVNRIGTSDNTKVYRVNPDQVEKAKEAAAIKNEKIVKEYQQNQRSFIGPDNRTKAEIDKGIALKKEYDKVKAMQNSDLAKTFASFTPGNNIEAGVMGAETFANLNPLISGPILATSRLAPAIMHPTNNAYWGSGRSNLENAFGALGAIGDMGMVTPFFKGLPNYKNASKTGAHLNKGINTTKQFANEIITPQNNIIEVSKNKENVKSLTDRLSEMLFEPEEKKSFGNMITDEIETNNFVKNYNKNFKKRYKDYSDFKKEYTDFYNEQVDVFGRTPEEVDPEGIMKDFSNPDYLNDVLGFNTYPNARNQIARGLSGDYKGANLNLQLDNGGRQLLPERGESIFKIGADNFGKYEQAKPWEVFDKNHFIRQNKYGGVIEDDMGQWAHPGQVTRINSNEITMEGVPYPVLGVDNTGYTQMMQPQMDYTFPGQYVTEYPMAQNGKEVKKDNIRQAYIDAYNNYSKRKFPAETLPIRQKAFRTVNPSSYLDFQNYNRWNRDEQRDVFYDPRSEEAWNFYLGLSKPEDLKYIRKSQYRPTINATDQNYYALDPELEQDIFNTFKDKVILNKTLQTDEGKVNTRLSGKNGAGALGRFGVSKGHDEKGDYLSYYDKYDLKDFAQDEAKGMPYSIYNRIYYPKKQYGGQNTDWEIIG